MVVNLDPNAPLVPFLKSNATLVADDGGGSVVSAGVVVLAVAAGGGDEGGGDEGCSDEVAAMVWWGSGGDVVEAREGNFVIPNVHYTPEVTLNVLSYDLLEAQGYKVKISNNKCNLHYMFGKARTGKAQEESFTKDDGLKDVVTEHNKFLDEYFESIDPKEVCSLVNGLEDLKCDKDDIHDYVDEEYISWNGSLYALK
nr:ARID DNA-binding domain-containing protein [Tanacetum cinerariifolium]